MEQSTVINSVIGEGTFYNGTIEAIDILRIDGNFTGTVRSNDIILVGMHGKVKGTLSSSNIIITGMIDGVIKNTPLVVLQSTSVTLGVIEAFSIIIESNAVVSAKLRSKNIRYINSIEQEEERATMPEDAMKKPLVRMVECFSSKKLKRMFSE